MDRTVSLTYVTAMILWVGTFGLILLGTAIGLLSEGTERMPLVAALMAFGLALSAAAATVTIRGFFTHQNRMLRDAFEMGRDASTQVRRVR